MSSASTGCGVAYRQGKAPDFTYVDKKGSRITSASVLAYIKKLAIPPKYTDVTIHIAIKCGEACAPAKLTYTGVDEAGRTQYGYSAAWKARASKAKFGNLIAFGTILPKMRLTVAEALADPHASDAPSLAFCIALIVRIVTICHFRLGNLKYKDLYKSYGVSNIETRHAKVAMANGKQILKISFIGKKGVKNDCAIAAPDVIAHMAGLMRGKGPRDPVFAYTAANGQLAPVRAADVNDWMRQFGMDISSKMFRTYATNVMLIERVAELLAKSPKGAPWIPKDHPAADINPSAMTGPQRIKLLNFVLDEVSGTVHNTRAVCKKEYVHPGVVDILLNHPRIYKTRFMTGAGAEAAFLAYLRASATDKPKPTKN